MKLPPHKCALYLEHNDCRSVYQTVAQHLEELASRSDGDMYQWQSDECKARAIATNEIWTLQWYPETPIGFNAVAAPTLEELLAFASE